MIAVEIRAGGRDDRTAVLGVLDAAMLETEPGAVREAIDRGDLLVADAAGRVVGACLLDGTRITAIAVRPGRRGQGIGSELVETAATDRAELLAEFDERVRPFWASLGFEIEPLAAAGRSRGRLRLAGDTNR